MDSPPPWSANLKSISHRCYLFEVACVWELTQETIVLPLGWLQGGQAQGRLTHRANPNGRPDRNPLRDTPPTHSVGEEPLPRSARFDFHLFSLPPPAPAPVPLPSFPRLPGSPAPCLVAVDSPSEESGRGDALRAMLPGESAARENAWFCACRLHCAVRESVAAAGCAQWIGASRRAPSGWGIPEKQICERESIAGCSPAAEFLINTARSAVRPPVPHS